MAMGMVMVMEKTPQGLSASALTMMSASTAMMITMMAMVATMPAAPPTRPTSSRIIWPRERPRRRVDTQSTR